MPVDLLKIIKERRSVRKFKSTDVEKKNSTNCWRAPDGLPLLAIWPQEPS